MTDPRSAWSPVARAALRYLAGDHRAYAEVVYEDGERERLEAADLLRADGFPEAEALALDLAHGRVLDVGAGAGPHALALQERGLAVTALDHLPALVEIMRARGIAGARVGDVFTFADQRFDTILLLMNGLGVAGALAGLRPLLSTLAGLLAPGGQVLADSSDLRHSDNPGEQARVAARRAAGRYSGDARYRLADPGGTPGTAYGWLFVDARTLIEQAADAGWLAHILFDDGEGGYLARLTPAV